MNSLGRVSAAVLALAIGNAAPAVAWGQDAHAGHHPAEATAPAQQEPAQAPAKPTGGEGTMQDRMGMMGDRAMPMKDAMMAGDMPMCPMMGGGMKMGDGMKMSARIDERLAAIRSQLAITSSQARSWDAYAAAMRGAAANMDKHHEAMMAERKGEAALSPVERLDRHDRMLGLARETIRTLRPALARLYAGLSAEQKQKADTLLTPHGMIQPGPMSGMMRR